MPEFDESLTGATLRLAGDDIYDAIRARDGDDHVDFGALEEPGAARELLHGVLQEHANLLPDAAQGADLAYRIAVVDAAYRPHPAVERRDAGNVRDHLVELVRHSLRDPSDDDAAELVVNLIEEAHRSGTRQHLAAMIAPHVRPSALMFLDLDCQVGAEEEVVGGVSVAALALFDSLDTSLPLVNLAGVCDPLHWPECNECFRSVKLIPGSVWASPVAYGVDVLEDFAIPFTDFRATTPLAITYIGTPTQTLMEYDLSRTHANLGDGQVDVDRGYARAVDLGTVRRLDALKIVHFRDDALANAASWFSCLWWDLMTVRTALLCPNRTVTPKDELEERAGPASSTPARSAAAAPGAASTAPSGSPVAAETTDDRGPLEQLVQDWSDLILGSSRECLGIATRNARRWAPGEEVTDGKLTSDLIEAFEHLTPLIGRSIDVGIRSTYRMGEQLSGRWTAPSSSAPPATAKPSTPPKTTPPKSKPPKSKPAKRSSS